jgi:D-ribose pyranase
MERMAGVDVAFVTHEAFKEMTGDAKAIIRTGEATPYSNIILQSGVLLVVPKILWKLPQITR